MARPRRLGWVRGSSVRYGVLDCGGRGPIREARDNLEHPRTSSRSLHEIVLYDGPVAVGTERGIGRATKAVSRGGRRTALLPQEFHLGVHPIWHSSATQ